MKPINLPDNLQKVLDEFTVNLKEVYGDGLISVVLYGSAASGEYTPGRSNINLLVLLSDAGLENLARSYRIINSRNNKPFKITFLTEDFIKSSSDIFPIEFLDMKENYAVLFGADPLAGLSISTKNLRFQCELELKSKLIILKSEYLRTEDPGRLQEMLFRTFTSALHILRNLIRLKGRTPAYPKEEIIRQVEEEFGINGDDLRKILAAKLSGKRLSHAECDRSLSALAKDLEEAAKIADRM